MSVEKQILAWDWHKYMSSGADPETLLTGGSVMEQYFQ